MSDSYQAVYDAVRSRMHGDFAGAVQSAARGAFEGFSYVPQHMQQEVYVVSGEMTRPSVLFRPSIQIDGDHWCALYGANLQEGVAGFGDSPGAAMRAFDEAWNAKLKPRTEASGTTEGEADR